MRPIYCISMTLNDLLAQISIDVEYLRNDTLKCMVRYRPLVESGVCPTELCHHMTLIGLQGHLSYFCLKISVTYFFAVDRKSKRPNEGCVAYMTLGDL